MTTFRVISSRRATDEANSASLWIAEQSPEAAHVWLDGLLQAIQSLATHPFRCALAPENDYFSEELRQLIYGRYRILFTIESDSVYIFSVRHGSREHLRPDEGDNEAELVN